MDRLTGGTRKVDEAAAATIAELLRSFKGHPAPRYWQRQISGGKSILDKLLEATSPNFESKRRQFCIDADQSEKISPRVDGELKPILEKVQKMDVDAICSLNRVLPGVIYQMPNVLRLLQELSIKAFRSTDIKQARSARDALKRIACPIAVSTKHPSCSRYILSKMNFILADFYQIYFLYRREARDGVEHSLIVAALKNTYKDIPAPYIDQICTPGSKIVHLASKRLSNLTELGATGVYKNWRANRHEFWSVDFAKTTARELIRDMQLTY